jgi:hypothetical protein
VSAPTATLALTVPIDHPAVVGIRDRIATLVREVEALTVGSDEQKTVAVNLLSTIARVKTEAEKARLGFVEAPKKYTAGVDRLFRETLAPMLGADQVLRRKVTDFDAGERRRIAEAQAEEERQRLQSAALLKSAERAEADGNGAVAEQLLDKAVVAERQAAAAAPIAAAAPPPKTFSTPFGAKATMRTVWDYRVVDGAAIPREYLVLDERKVRAEIAAGVRSIAGLEIFEREALTVRA